MADKTKDAQGYTAFQRWWHGFMRMEFHQRIALAKDPHKLAEAAWDASEERFRRENPASSPSGDEGNR